MSVVVIAGGGEVAALAANGAWHALRIGAALDVGAVGRGGHQPGAAFDDGLFDTRAFGAGEKLVVFEEVHRGFGDDAGSAALAHVARGFQEQVDLVGERHAEGVDLDGRYKVGLTCRGWRESNRRTEAVGRARLVDRATDRGLESAGVKPRRRREAPLSVQQNAQPDPLRLLGEHLADVLVLDVNTFMLPPHHPYVGVADTGRHEAQYAFRNALHA